MTQGKNMPEEEELTEADRQVLQLYRKSQTPIDWDESDEAVLSFARSAKRSGADAAAHRARTSPRAQPKPDSLIRLPSWHFDWRSLFAPGPGLAVAASLALGAVLGQAVLPYFNLGVSREYAQLVEDNERLGEEIARFGDLQGAEDYFQVVQERDQLQAEIQALRDLDQTPGAEELGVPLERSASLAELSNLLGSFECAALAIGVTEGGRVIVSGTVANAADLTRLQETLGSLERSGTIVNRATVAGMPYCQALETIMPHLGLGSAPGLAPSVRPHGRGSFFTQGEAVVIAATAPDRFGGYLYVDVLRADGRVRHLSQGEAKVDAGEQLLLEDETSPPFATAIPDQALILVVSAPAPLFENSRPEEEAAADYFPQLAAALERSAQATPADPVVANYSFLRPTARQ